MDSDYKENKVPSGNGYCRDIHVPDYLKEQANDRSIIDAGLAGPIEHSSKKQAKAFRGTRN